MHDRIQLEGGLFFFARPLGGLGPLGPLVYASVLNRYAVAAPQTLSPPFHPPPSRIRIVLLDVKGGGRNVSLSYGTSGTDVVTAAKRSISRATEQRAIRDASL